ncbi:MAG TPA: hypothetical protein VE266_01515, partial [Steroidobacteraceae bacterium]|nr:hypothetical protein [Steroidobacteraceae bacterium]
GQSAILLSEGIPIELELPAVLGELRTEGHDVALRAGQTRLARKTRNRGGDARQSHQHAGQRKDKIEIAAPLPPLPLRRVDCNTIPEPSLIHGTFRFKT